VIKGMFPPSGLSARGPQEPSVSTETSAQRTAEGPLIDAAFSHSPGMDDSPTRAPKTAYDIAKRHGGITTIGDTTIHVEVVAA
jgi:hypothetical protein